MTDKNLICVGALSGSYGVRGQVRLKSFCAEPEAIEDYNPLFSENGERQFLVKITRAVKGGFAAKVENLNSKEDADALKGTLLYAHRNALPGLPDDEFYYSDLVGLLVLDTGGAEIGRVIAVQDHGAGDVLEVAGVALKTPLLLPFTQTTVPTVDIKSGRLIVDLPDEF